MIARLPKVAAVALLFCGAFPLPRRVAAQACRTDDPPCPPDDPPQVTIVPNGGTFSSARLSVTIYFDDDYGLQPGSISVNVSGASLVSSTFSSCGSYSCVGTYELELQAGSGNTITASVLDIQSQLSSASATYTYNAPPPPPQRGAPAVSISPHNGDNRDFARCVAACFENVLSYATPAYTSLDAARSVTLTYSRAQATAVATVQVDATDISVEAPSKMSLLLRRPDQTWVTFTNNSTEVFFQSGTGTTRLAAQVDMSGLSTGAYDYTVVVRSWWADGSFLESTSPIELLVLRENLSPYGYGWSIAGLQRVTPTSAGAVVTNGDGSVAFFAGCTTLGSTCMSPKGDFTTLTRRADGSGYDRTWLDGTTAAFDTQGRLASMRDRYGNQTNFSYNGSTFQLASITDPAGMITSLFYDGSGKLDYVRDPGSRVTQVTVNGSGDLTEIFDPDNVLALRVTYDGTHVPQSVLDRRQGQWDFTYDVAGKLSQVTLPTVTANGQAVRPVRRLRSIEGQVLAPSGTGTSANPAPRRLSDSLRAQVKEPRGDSTRYALDRFGQATRIEFRDPQGRWRISTWTYNEDGEVLRAISPQGHSTTNTWSGPDLTNITDDNTGSGTEILYAAYHQVDRVWVDGNLVQQNFYGPLGQLDSSKAGTSKTSYTYDGRGRVLTVTDPQGHQSTTAYLPTGTQNAQSVTAPNGSGNTGTYTFQYDGMGRVTSVTDHTGRLATREYDLLNRVTTAVGMTFPPRVSQGRIGGSGPAGRPGGPDDRRAEVHG